MRLPIVAAMMMALFFLFCSSSQDQAEIGTGQSVSQGAEAENENSNKAPLDGKSFPEEKAQKAKEERRELDPSQTPSAKEHYDAFEALFRSEITRFARSRIKPGESVYLKISDEDPPGSLLKRFEGNSPMVKRGSEFVRDQGVLLWIHSWKWFSLEELEIYAGHRKNGLDCSGSYFTLRKTNGRWVVESQRMYFIC